jgi:ABC-2 type transport system ATP-binding protein
MGVRTRRADRSPGRQLRHELLDLIKSLRDRFEMTVLVSTHHLEEARRLCDRVAIMHEGRIAGLDTPSRLLRALGEEILELRVDGDAAVALAALQTRGIAHGDAFVIGSTLTVPLHGRTAADAIASLRALNQATSGLTTRAPTLDDVYLRLTGDMLPEAA